MSLPTLSNALHVLIELFDRPTVLLRGDAVVCANQLAWPFLNPNRTQIHTPLDAARWHFVGPERIADEGLTLAVHDRACPDSQLARLVQRWRLTPREGEVLAQLSAGAANKDIANDLDCSERTVEVHMSRLLSKSGTASRAELVARFWTLGH